MSAAPDSDRYATLRRLDWLDHARLREARVLVAGAGALGNGVLQLLALYGFGEVVIVDRDVVEPANLSRSPLFRPADVGRPKAEAAAHRLREINPDVRVRAIVADLTTGVGLGEYRRAAVVFGCLDSRAARLAVNRACWRAGVPWIEGGIDVWVGVCRLFAPPDGPCYACTMTDADWALVEQRYPCMPANPAGASIPTLPTTAAIIAALQVQEAVKLLHGLATPGEGVFYDGQTNQIRRVRYSRLVDCYAHETWAPVVDLGVSWTATLADLLEKVGPGAVLRLEREVVRTLTCPICGLREVVYAPRDEVADAGCPNCGADRLPSVVARLARSAEGDAIPLSRLGIPPRHIVRVDRNSQPLFVELVDQEGV